MLKMRPYRIIMKGISPVVISGFAPSLDGILYEALSQVLATDFPETIRRGSARSLRRTWISW